MSKAYRCFVLIFFLSLVSCGYHWQIDEEVLYSFSVPFVEGEDTGFLTNALIQSLETSPYFTYEPNCGRFILEVVVVGITTEKIGLQKNGDIFSKKRKKSLQAVENRDSITTRLQVLTQARQLVLGPIYFENSVEYDYIDGNLEKDLVFFDSGGKKQASIAFSLGQLEGFFPAKEDAAKDLYRRIAEKIIERLSLEYGQLPEPCNSTPKNF